MIKELEEKLLQGKYVDAEKICEKMDIKDAGNMIMNIAYDTENICVYSFVQYMIWKTERIEWMELAIDIMINPFCFLEGAYSVALFYLREVLRIKKNIENLERILFFYHIPEKLVGIEEAKKIAEEILKIEPTNKLVLELNL